METVLIESNDGDDDGARYSHHANYIRDPIIACSPLWEMLGEHFDAHDPMIWINDLEIGWKKMLDLGD